MWQLDTYDYDLPSDRIAQTPAPDRDQSRLLVLDRRAGSLAHRRFFEVIDLLEPGDILVANNSRVLAGRLFGRKATGGRVEILLLERLSPRTWKTLVGGRRLVAGLTLELLDRSGKFAGVSARIDAVLDGPLREITFSAPVDDWLEQSGHLPLPPYIQSALADEGRYQTVYARRPGSAAAPTAGLHFSSELLLALREKGVLFDTVTLHIGLDTFKPVETPLITEHSIHREWASLSPDTAERINATKLAGGRIIAVGTTTVRTLETAALRSAGISGSLQDISQRDAAGETSAYCPWQPVAAFEGETDLYIYPGYRFRAIDALITNFHMPRSTLLMMLVAFAGQEPIQKAYQAALAGDYRFLSLGDAMFIH